MNARGYQRRTSYRLLLITLWIAGLVFAVELTAGWVSHSLCLLAESLHTLIDGFSALLSLVAVASPRRTLGREIWGHGRGEASSALVLCAVLGFAGLSILLVALKQFTDFFATTQNTFAVQITLPLVVLITAIASLLLSVVAFSAHKSKSINSLGLKLNVQHVLSDAWLNLVVIVALFLMHSGYLWMDPLLAIFLVGWSAVSLWRLLNRQLPMLLKPMAIAPEAIAQVACQVEGVTRCTKILSRGLVGRHVWIELHLALHPEFMVIASTIGERVERRLREHYGPVKAQIWLDSKSF